jgi:site-specific DNA-cytosine methylase
MKKIILHLCADIGSDSRFYQLDNDYEVIKIGKDIGVENYNPPNNVYGIIANPVCTEFSTVSGFNKVGDLEKGMFLVNHCLRIIEMAKPTFWILENPAKGRLKEKLGKPKFIYQPWHFGSPWSKQTAIWGEFNIPKKIYTKWEDVPNKLDLWKRKDRDKPCLTYLHKSAKNIITEFEWAKDLINDDMSLRSMCSQGFAKSFYEANK